MTLQIAGEIKDICTDLDIHFVFKASFRKANRTKRESFRGIGDDPAIQILRRVKAELQVPITTDVHEVQDIEKLDGDVDIIQIPAFLSRQSALLEAAADTGKIINVKKGQFASGESMCHAIDKINARGNDEVMLTERGNSFGYSDLIVDMRNIPIMQELGVPVILDCTHANQRPNQSSGITGGTREYIEHLARAGVAVGADGIFLETHPVPDQALSDGSNMLPLNELHGLLTRLIRIKEAL